MRGAGSGSTFKTSFVDPSELGKRTEATCSGGCRIGFGACKTQFRSCSRLQMTVG